MTTDQSLILAILLATIAMFLWGRWRHDMVAVAALLACVASGLIAPTQAFGGLGHPAVVTVACVLVLSRGLQSSGAIDALARHIVPNDSGPTLAIAALTGLGAALSGFMNNVGALALLMPVAIQMAGRHALPPGRVLMPLAFGTILGGMTTLIGTPPNLIVSGFRAAAGGGAFGMFDFTPVGLSVAAVCVAFVAVLGWRLVPARRQAGAEGFDTAAYITEARVPEDSKAAGKTLRAIEAVLDESDAQVVALVRNDFRLNAPHASRVVRAGDILLIEAEAEALGSALSSLGLELEEAKKNDTKEDDADETDTKRATSANGAARRSQHESGKTAGARAEEAEKPEPSDEIVLTELAVLPGSALVGRNASEILLRSRYGINLLAVSRHGRRSMTRLRTFRFAAGDLLLLQGPPETLTEFANDSGCVPLAQRELRIPDRRKTLLAGGIMAAAVGSAAVGLVPTVVSFAAGVLASMALRTVPPRSVYEAIDWPVIMLLAALIPVAGAMESTGTASLIAHGLLEDIAQGHAIVALGLILVVTMTLSDLMNNAATAAVMCPIALGTAAALGTNSDPFLMAVAIGASCAFLTPIGHQNNTLILGPGGFRFGDYWRLGLPIEVLVVAVGIPMLLLIWPL
ncbi:MAG TPA: SLC13 family permease [Rhodocyclaceae bacterium]|nr:SLC13 family permease [Rhodocyclaceae bacterium]